MLRYSFTVEWTTDPWRDLGYLFEYTLPSSLQHPLWRNPGIPSYYALWPIWSYNRGRTCLDRFPKRLKANTFHILFLHLSSQQNSSKPNEQVPKDLARKFIVPTSKLTTTPFLLGIITACVLPPIGHILLAPCSLLPTLVCPTLVWLLHLSSQYRRSSPRRSSQVAQLSK